MSTSVLQFRWFELNDCIPEAVKQELLPAFYHFHSDLTASGIKVRRALEHDCKQSEYTYNKLNVNIQAMKDKYPNQSLWLDALKLVRNEATHSDGITENDLLLSFEVMNETLDIFARIKRHQ